MPPFGMVALLAIASVVFGLVAVAIGWPLLGWASLVAAPILTSLAILALSWTLFRLSGSGRRTVSSASLRVRHARHGS